MTWVAMMRRGASLLPTGALLILMVVRVDKPCSSHCQLLQLGCRCLQRSSALC